MPYPVTLNPVLEKLPVYQPGRPIEEVARELGLPAETIIKLASNENPLGPSPMALAAMRRTLDQIHLYPDGNAFYLKQKLAASLQVQTANLLLGNGSNEVLEMIGHAAILPGDEVIVSQYCFAVYPIVTHLFGAKLVSVPARNHTHDLPAMLAAVTPKTKVIFVAQPNNPTGTMAPEAELLRLVENAPPHVLVVVDEAYIEFMEKPLDLLALVRSGARPNLCLVRTFSKIYGLAGLRIGYGIGHPDFIAALEKVREPFNTNIPAQVGAMAALEDHEHIRKTRENNLAGLKLIAEGCQRLGLESLPSAGNFILVRVGQGQQVFVEMQKRGVIVRPMGGYQLPEWIRISIGTAAENQRCLDSLQAVLGK